MPFFASVGCAAPPEAWHTGRHQACRMCDGESGEDCRF